MNNDAPASFAGAMHPRPACDPFKSRANSCEYSTGTPGERSHRRGGRVMRRDDDEVIEGRAVPQVKKAKPQSPPLPPREPIFFHVVFALAKWGLVALGCLFCLIAFKADNAIQTAAWAGLACFVGVLARMAQAEELHRWK